jgi:hypothetical protein
MTASCSFESDTRTSAACTLDRISLQRYWQEETLSAPSLLCDKAKQCHVLLPFNASKWHQYMHLNLSVFSLDVAHLLLEVLQTCFFFSHFFFSPPVREFLCTNSAGKNPEEVILEVCVSCIATHIKHDARTPWIPRQCKPLLSIASLRGPTLRPRPLRPPGPGAPGRTSQGDVRPCGVSRRERTDPIDATLRRDANGSPTRWLFRSAHLKMLFRQRDRGRVW